MKRVRGRREPEASLLGGFPFLTDSVMTWEYGITLSKCAVRLWRPDGPYPTAAGPGSHGVTLWMHISCLYPAGLAQQHRDAHETRELTVKWRSGQEVKSRTSFRRVTE